MIEILVADGIEVPVVERKTLIVRISVPPTIAFEDIAAEIWDLLSDEEIRLLSDLWCNDAAERVFEKVEEGWLITLRQFSTRWRPRKSSLAPSVDRP